MLVINTSRTVETTGQVMENMGIMGVSVMFFMCVWGVNMIFRKCFQFRDCAR